MFLRTRKGVAVFSVTLAALLGCTPLPYAEATATSELTVKPLVSEHVIVVSIDGLRPDAIAKFGAKTIQRLMREGSYSLAATTILPSKTLPTHASMLTAPQPTS